MSAENAPPTAAEPSVEYMGALIRRLRESAGMTLTDLSRVAGVSQGLLSQIERGRGNPAYLTLLKIAKAFDVPVGRFFDSGGEPADNRVVRADKRRQLQVTDRGLVYELLTPTMNGQLLVLKARIPAGYSNESVPFNHHRAEECLFVLEGTCYFQVGEDGYTLDAGDSITYQGDQPHWFRVVGDAEAVIIATMTPPVF
ncbi:XRE family transcriptional regulator [Brevibacterium sp. BDJS002]|uniref:Transcriptional regulator n=1 Tax=Brevibacterium aurantiacum TaxID=273384 RepID=A0A2H1KGR0_BREAU|nr:MULTISPECIES: XRE family transcriptional regulator [Brevibacterium]AZT94513.1 transcriptional regulator [Brevibacterium aurantiacum]MDN5773426.1 XRE family transcriptional regulator [Brevibacterium aurantiacum]WCE39377.1 XRE family transcriptional regulator [Brevibacterium sp. BDJS002]SMX98995.1 transcriptional regulator, XRE family with cupin sensor [Brevibacterium aurantiacum]GEB24693.1 DNA-binding protein [Brevibacterium aurantiacum]